MGHFGGVGPRFARRSAATRRSRQKIKISPQALFKHKEPECIVVAASSSLHRLVSAFPMPIFILHWLHLAKLLPLPNTTGHRPAAARPATELHRAAAHRAAVLGCGHTVLG